MALEPAKLSDFAIAGALGAGTTARVYEAVHTPTGQAVAIKRLEPSQQAPETRERFAREALLLAGVQSRHVGKMLGFGFDRGQPFLVLERLVGETLDAKLRRDGPVPVPLALRWVEQLIVGVRDCHDANIIHRDIKPSNIFLHVEGFDEVVKVIDFGVARLKEVTGDPGLTATQAVIGSMGYMAPEQFRDAKSVDFTADMYAIGVVVFRTLTGRLPFVSRSLDAVIRMKMEQTVPPVSSMPGMPQNALLDAFVQRAMARDPSHRHPSARDMLEHWWNVMASLDEDAATDVMRGIGRVDESYAGPLHHRPRVAVGRPEQGSESSIAVTRRNPSPPPPADEERTLQRDAAAPSERTMLDLAPATLPGGAEPAELAAGEAGQPDPAWEITRNDPNLRKLVERELELQRRAKPRG